MRGGAGVKVGVKVGVRVRSSAVLTMGIHSLWLYVLWRRTGGSSAVLAMAVLAMAAHWMKKC